MRVKNLYGYFAIAIISILMLIVGCNSYPLTTTPSSTSVPLPTTTSSSIPSITFTSTALLSPDLIIVPSPSVVSSPITKTVSPDANSPAFPTPVFSIPIFSKQQLVHIYPLAPDLEWNSSTSNNLWWIDDGHTLVYQDEVLMDAWSYDLETGASNPVSYTSRSLDDIYLQVTPLIPDESKLYSASPQQQNLLFAVPLPALIPLTPPKFDDEDINPAYVAELWVLRNGQADYLGLVDLCFLMSQPRWALHENKAVINTVNISDVQRACMTDIWVVDLESLKVEPFDVALDLEKEYIARDLSPSGSHMFISESGSNPKQYLFAFDTGEYVELEYNMSLTTLLEYEGEFAFIGQKVEYGTSINDYSVSIWYMELSGKKSMKLATFKGLVSQWSISPDQNYIVLVISSRDVYRDGSSSPDFDAGVWLVTLP